MVAHGRTSYMRAWPLLLASLICYFLTGTVSSIMNVAVGVLEAERGWSATTLTASMSIASLANVVTGFVAGRLVVRWSAKRACALWGGLYCIGIALMGVATNMAAFVAGMVVATAASSAWGYNTVPVLITNWFPTKKGTVQGFVSMGILLGSFSTVLYTQARRSFGVALATVPFVFLSGLALILILMLVTNRPEQRGLAPDTLMPLQEQVRLTGGANPQESSFSSEEGEDVLAVEADGGHSADNGGAARVALSPRFLLLSAILGLQLVYAGGIMVQVVPRLVEVGFTLGESTAALIGASVFACAGSFVFGVVGDRFGVDVGVRLSFAAGALAALMNLVPDKMVVLASLVLISVVVGSADNWPVNVCAEYFGREGFSETFGVMFPLIQLVGAAGPALFALVAQMTGSYDLSYALAAAMMISGLIAYQLLRGSLKKELRH